MRHAALLLLCFSMSAYAAEMSHEETVVRTAYAKFAYASEQYAIGTLALEADGKALGRSRDISSEQWLNDTRVRFTLTNFKVGDIAEILNSRAIDLISPPEGEMLRSGGSSESYVDQGLATHWSGLKVRWVPANVISPMVAMITIDQMYELGWNKPRPDRLWQRYASYDVTVTFQGKTAGPYKALFIFGHDADGNEVVEPKDTTTDPSGLAAGLHEHLFPDAFVLTRLRNYPVVALWLNTKRMSDPSCSVGHGDVCCDLIKMQCGPGKRDIADGLRKPLPSEKKGD